MSKPKPPSHLLAIPLKSDSSRYILCRITGIQESYPLVIVATDGESPFSATLSKADLRGGKSGSFDGTDNEWLKLLFDALFVTGKSDVQLSAQMTKRNDTITVNIQKSVEDQDSGTVTIRYGSVEIPRDDEASVELFDWLVESSQATIAAQVTGHRPTNPQTKARKSEKMQTNEHDIIEKLQNQLDTLIKAKEEHETELIVKFNMLLNEKKAKIRELTNNGPVPEARIPNSPEPEDTEIVKPKRGAKTKTIKAKPVKPTKPAPVNKNKRKKPPTPEPEIKEDTPMPDVNDGSATEDEDDSVQADEERDVDVERTFGLRNDDEDVTEDEEL